MENLDRRFGLIAIEKGFIKLDHLLEAMKIQIVEDVENTKHRLIGQILFEKGYLTGFQIDEVLKSMGV